MDGESTASRTYHATALEASMVQLYQNEFKANPVRYFISRGSALRAEGSTLDAALPTCGDPARRRACSGRGITGLQRIALAAENSSEDVPNLEVQHCSSLVEWSAFPTGGRNPTKRVKLRRTRREEVSTKQVRHVARSMP
jgi:hypothetical protein